MIPATQELESLAPGKRKENLFLPQMWHHFLPDKTKDVSPFPFHFKGEEKKQTSKM